MPHPNPNGKRVLFVRTGPGAAAVATGPGGRIPVSLVSAVGKRGHQSGGLLCIFVSLLALFAAM
jgi:hypothetical protein